MLPATKQRAIYLSLKDQILRGTLPPGHRLIIQNIADAAGLSAIPVREALQLLEAERLVEIRPHAGASVAGLSPGNIDETFTILEGMEAVAVRRVATRMSPQLGATLRALLAEMDGAENRDDEEKWSRLNMAFHLAISDATAMPWLREITEEALVNWDRIRRHFFHNHPHHHRFADAQREHHQILHALLAHDPDLAEKLIRHHNHRAFMHYSAIYAGGAAPHGGAAGLP